MRAPAAVRVGAATHAGRVREANEDRYLAAPPLFAVADGMGGHAAGDVAAEVALQTIQRAAQREREANAADAAEWLQAANAAILERAGSDGLLRGMATTCTLAVLDGMELHLAHVGDSRAYRVRDGDLVQLTEDHTFVAQLVQQGVLSPREALVHPRRGVLLRGLGHRSRAVIDERRLELLAGDRLLLCSDGLTSMVDDPSIAAVLLEETDAQRAADRLVALANDAGGVDNVTVLVVDVDGDHSQPRHEA
jgi:serine/threonine protein phosphatase PrpC